MGPSGGFVAESTLVNACSVSRVRQARSDPLCVAVPRPTSVASAERIRLQSVVAAMRTPPWGMVTSESRSDGDNPLSRRSAVRRSSCSPPAGNDSSSTISATLRPSVFRPLPPNGAGSDPPGASGDQLERADVTRAAVDLDADVPRFEVGGRLPVGPNCRERDGQEVRPPFRGLLPG